MALRDQPYLPLYIKDFMTNGRLNDCSAAANGVFIRLMCIMHRSEEYGMFLLKQNDKQIIFSASDFASRLEKQMPFKEEVIAAALDELVFYGVIKIEGSKILQERMVRDNQLSEIRAIAGKKGGETTGICLSKMTSKTQANTAYAIDNVIQDKKEIVKGKKRANGAIDLFNQFWSLYPKKLSKKAAEKVFMKTNPLEFNQIIESLEKWKTSDQWTKDEGQFIPFPATWLNGERWNDEIPKQTRQESTLKANGEGGFQL